jgi:hypothetical protein
VFKRLYIFVGTKVAVLDEPTIQLVIFVFAGGYGEAVADFARNDAPAIALTLFDGLMEAVELWKEKVNNLYCYQCQREQRFTMVSLKIVSLAFNLVQYRICSVPELRPGKKSAICFHVKFFVSFSSTSKASSSGENLSFGPLGLMAGSGMPGSPTTDSRRSSSATWRPSPPPV